MLSSNTRLVSSVSHPAVQSLASPDRCALNRVVLNSLGVSVLDGRLVAAPGVDLSAFELADPPSSNTGGTYLIPESILDLAPTQNYVASLDWLTLSAPYVRPQFENFLDLYANVLRPLFASMQIDLLVDGPSAPEDGYFIRPSGRGARFFKGCYEVIRRMRTPVGYIQDYLAAFFFDSVTRDAHNLALSITGVGCRALGIAYGGVPAAGLVDFLRSENVCLTRDFHQGDTLSPWRIARLDVALDDFRSELGGLKSAYQEFLTGGFTTRGRTPDIEVFGPALHSFAAELVDTIADKGSTINLGSRKHSSKYFRIYEKRKERIEKGKVDPEVAGVVYPELRYEVEFKHSGDYFVPLDAVLCPLSLWASACPYFERVASMVLQDVAPLPLVRHVPDKVAVMKDYVSKGIKRAREVCGGLFRFAQQCNIPSNRIVQAIVNAPFVGLPTVWDMESDKVRPIVKETRRVFELYASCTFSYEVPF